MNRREFLVQGALAATTMTAPGGLLAALAQGAPSLVLLTPLIVIATTASESEQYAAQELALYLKKIGGQEVEWRRDDAPPAAGQPLIVVGHHPLNNDLQPETLELEESVISVEANRLRVVGGKLPPLHGNEGQVYVRDRGTLYGVYNLLDLLGVRWYAPGDENEYVPHRERIELPLGKSNIKPTYRYRYGYYLWNKTDGPELVWAIRNRLNVDTGTGIARFGGTEGISFNHNYASLMPQWKYFKEHPEYYALIGGKRKEHPEAQLCVSNPEVQQIAGDALVAYARANSWRTIVSVEPNDGALWCECDNCKAWDDPELMGAAFGYKKPSMSNRVVRFSNIMARRLAKEAPGTSAGWLAYLAHAEAPTTALPLEPNTAVQVAANPAFSDYSRKLRDPAPAGHNVRLMKVLEGYKGLTRLFAYEYWAGYAWIGPLPIVHVMHDRLTQYNRDFGIIGVYCEAQYHWGVQGMNAYLFTRLLWNAGLDIEKEVADYCKNFYGPAGKAILRYHQAWEEASQNGPMYHSGGSYIQRLILKNDALFEKLKPLVEAAQTAAQGKQPYETRVQSMVCGYEVARQTYLIGQYNAQGKHLQAIDAMQQIRDTVLEKSPPGTFDRGAFNAYVFNYMVALTDPFRHSRDALTALKPYKNVGILQELNSDWHFSTGQQKVGLARGVTRSTFSPIGWKTVTAEKSWQEQGDATYQGDAWYHRIFDYTLPVNRQRVLLYFTGVGGVTTVYLNGTEVERKNADEAKAPFVIDITDKVQSRKNVLVVHISSSAPQSGLYGGVTLLKAAP